MTFDEIKEICLTFPGVAEHTVFGGPTLRVGKRFLACIAKIDHEALVLKLPDANERDFLLATQPDVFYVTDHYADFGSILIRMPQIERELLFELVEQAWMQVAPKKLVKQYQAKE